MDGLAREDGWRSKPDGLESREYATPNSHGHDREALELTRVLAAAPGYRMLSIGPWRIIIAHDYTNEPKED